MPTKFTIGTKLLSGAAAMFVLAGVQGYFGLLTANRFKDQFDKAVDQTVRKVMLADKIGMANSEMISAQRGIILAAFAKDKVGIEKYEQTFQEQDESIQKSGDEIRPLLVKEEGKALTAEITAEVSQWRQPHAELVRQAIAWHVAEADHIRKDLTAPIYSKLAAAARRLEVMQTEILADDKARLAEQNASSRQIALGLLALCLVVALVVVFIVRGVNREIRKAVIRLGEGAEQVASAAGQVSSASQSLAQGSSEQAASLEETSSSSAEISSMTRKNAENSKVAAEFTGEVEQRVTGANRTLEHMVASMTEINTSSEKVSKIIKVIDEIAFQTNILALNAAVEAARAGEAGMGFAVVADEVRNLAQRCAQAAKDTASLIEESMTKSDDGMAKSNQVAEAIRSITESVAKVKTLVDEVNLGSQEQARGIEQISRAITQMEQVTQKNAANAEESASASEELSAQAETMRGVVRELEALVGGGAQDINRVSHVPKGRANPGGISGTPVSRSGNIDQSLIALKSSVAHRSDRSGAATEPVAAGKFDRDSLPLDDDFKEF